MTDSNVPAEPTRPVLHRADDRDEVAAAVAILVDRLQSATNADQYDSLFASDVLWGSPKGQVLQGYSLLNSIHRSMMGGAVAAVPTSVFQAAQSISPAPGVVVTHIRRQAVTPSGEPDPSGFSEMAMYVLVKTGGQWWLAAGQNTPVSDVLPNQ